MEVWETLRLHPAIVVTMEARGMTQLSDIPAPSLTL
ncbi:MAG: hypothetical protein CM15mP125_0750 [Gammaproteobacteria bacterium]|nr:MAG: hypothetical protein CM15mP125_0750 [Gammaproteobacteria bacterium]